MSLQVDYQHVLRKTGCGLCRWYMVLGCFGVVWGVSMDPAGGIGWNG